MSELASEPSAQGGPTPSPPWPATVAVPGLRAPVEITRDARGIPSVTGVDLAGAMCGLGYATARDRMFQLDLLRRRASGTLAELAGPAAVDEDVRQRRLDLSTAAATAARGLPERHRVLLEAYRAGVNQAIDDAPPPFELTLAGVPMRAWRVEDSLKVALLLSQQLSGDGTDARMRRVLRAHLPPAVAGFLLSEADPYRVDAAGRPLPPRAEPVPAAAIRDLVAAWPGRPAHAVVSERDPWGSNICALAGDRTPDGRAVLSSDMHLPLTAPTLFYRATLRWPGHRVDGVVVPGLPVFVAGSTPALAWGATRLAGDTVDLVEPSAGTPPVPRRERILVRGADPVDVELGDTPDGPVHGTAPGGGRLVLRWPVREPGGLTLDLLDLVTAAGVAEAGAIARAARGAPLNLVFADRTGRVGWAVSGTFPGETGPLPADALPESLDPPEGVIVNANNRMPGHDRVAGNHFGARRAARIGELLAGRPAWREAELLAVQADTDAGFYAFYRDLALSVLDAFDDAAAGSADRESLRAGLRNWDGTARPGAAGLPALVLFRELARETWFSCLLSGCARADPGFRYVWHNHEAPLRALLSHPDLVPAPHRRRVDFLRAELDLTAHVLRRLVPGTPPGEVCWGALNPSGARHPFSAALPELATTLDLDQAPIPGCAETVFASRPGFGPAFRLVASPGHLDDALANLPGGQSGNPADPTYRDQYAAWRHARPDPLAAGPPVSTTCLRPDGGQT